MRLQAFPTINLSNRKLAVKNIAVLESDNDPNVKLYGTPSSNEVYTILSLGAGTFTQMYHILVCVKEAFSTFRRIPCKEYELD